ncbi:MAG: DUF393 domain-containing protein, partial [Acidobacteria bacterium]|nr:DUF393 domain-containing protein [Acidobacteriota bacterium]
MPRALTRMPPSYTALYDDQCEICQAGITWIKLLDKRGQVCCQPIDPDALPRLDPRLTMEGCARELHVLGPNDRIWRVEPQSASWLGCSRQRGCWVLSLLFHP